MLPKLATFKLNRVLFEPYNEMQLVSIITARCTQESRAPKGAEGDVRHVFHPAAAMLCARKVSQKSAGDARKALELASVAVGALLSAPAVGFPLQVCSHAGCHAMFDADVACGRHVCTGTAADGYCWEGGHLVAVADMATALARVYRSTSATLWLRTR
jgi:hypothetical protein